MLLYIVSVNTTLNAVRPTVMPSGLPSESGGSGAVVWAVVAAVGLLIFFGTAIVVVIAIIVR